MYSPTHWLVIHDIAIQTDYISDALVEFLYVFLSKSGQTLYENRSENIEKKCSVSVEGINSIKQSLQPLKKKYLTKAGKQRKEVIIKQLFYKKKMILMQLSLFSSALIPLKEYMMLFQQAEAAIHKLYNNQFKVMREFLANFIKP